MNINTHKIMFGINKDKTVDSLSKTIEGVEGLKWYKGVLSSNFNNPQYANKNSVLVKELDKIIKVSLYKFKYQELENLLISFHDEKVKNSSFISKDYLNYLALKNTSKTIDEINIDADIDAIDKIINFLQANQKTPE
ncbi:hypothetical protein [Alkaliphilus sp. B6464]|uniref:hypothetical protein n=1 Tax=Alkaliphilus sp. B6464 TaxID=2731219 RepID=UPI001BAB52A5|nr:hypothetical protein [Alkaliphilus sp. B6464]QUH21946.1 hypothetical protein HYG84_18745 [Alkaliphilus sp. B6464]